jgi:hypothetical protein
LASAGCSNAKASEFSSADPVACLTIFGITANGAQQGGKPALAEEMVGRSTRLVQQQGGLPWLKEVQPRAMEVAKTMEAKLDGAAAITLLEQCRDRQDAERR